MHFISNSPDNSPGKIRFIRALQEIYKSKGEGKVGVPRTKEGLIWLLPRGCLVTLIVYFRGCMGPGEERKSLENAKVETLIGEHSIKLGP